VAMLTYQMDECGSVLTAGHYPVHLYSPTPVNARSGLVPARNTRRQTPIFMGSVGRGGGLQNYFRETTEADIVPVNVCSDEVLNQEGSPV